MKITIHPKVIYRVPRFPITADLKGIWTELKEAIRFSSEDFYDIIKDTLKEDIDHLPTGVLMTLFKYFNRSKFRATPYGTFAAVGITKMEWNRETLVLEDSHRVHEFPDWSLAANTEAAAQEIQSKEILYFTNSTYYRVQDDIRYIQLTGGEFQISAIDYDEIVMLILECCQKPLKFDDLAKLTQKDIPQESLSEYLEALIEAQLVLTSLQPNIIGEEYFSRINSFQNKFPQKYLIAERRPTKGSVDASCFRHLPKVTSLLHDLVPPKQAPELIQFTEQFMRKFEQLEIPLMEALDPEIGIGYGKMETRDGALTLLDHLHIKAGTSDDPEFKNLRNALYPEIIKALLHGQPIRLENIRVGESDKRVPLPNSISALLTMSGDELYLESLGGSTGTSLLGRFGLAIAEIHEFCKDIARLEQQANPDVLFFDVGYVKEGRVDNINRRPSIYPLSLCILNYDTSDAPLSLTDILVSVRGNDVYLRSRKFNKRLIPRLTTAYNFTRSDLSLFRFLMDLQQQGLKTRLLFRPQNLIPGLNHYPRIQFANIIISRASWYLSNDIYEQVKDNKTRKQILSSYLNTHVPCRYVRAGNGDQTLSLDTHNAQDMQQLSELMNKTGKIMIEESTLPSYSKVSDQVGGVYLPELIVTLQHQDSIYPPLPDLSYLSPDLNKKLWIPPGGEWLYFEIYSSVVYTDALLSRIKIYLAQYKHIISRWFFIRYNEDGEHLRLRIQLTRQEKAYDMIRELSRLFQQEIQSGIISDLKLRTYKKEIQRYSMAQMEDLETHFCQDSKFVLQLIASGATEMQKYKLCVEVLQSLLEFELLEFNHFQKLIRVTLDAFIKEQNAGPDAFKELNRIYREYLSQGSIILDADGLSLYNTFKQSFLKNIENTMYKAIPKRAADLMHMHINRLFPTNQRTHELIVYYILNCQEKRNSAITATQ